MGLLLSYLRSILMPLIGDIQHYQMDYVPGIIAHCMTGNQHILLHVVADLGNRHIDFCAVRNVRVRIRSPRGAKSVRLLRGGRIVPFDVKNGWVEVVIPDIDVYEVVSVELHSRGL